MAKTTKRKVFQREPLVNKVVDTITAAISEGKKPSKITIGPTQFRELMSQSSEFVECKNDIFYLWGCILEIGQTDKIVLEYKR
jgi:hypothetical protein